MREIPKCNRRKHIYEDAENKEEDRSSNNENNLFILHTLKGLGLSIEEKKRANEINEDSLEEESS